ncbi:MAG: hypothetical protein ACFCVD_21350 [Nodosilinea sp.]
MATVIRSIRFNRLALALVVTFFVADTFPHPALGPGLLETILSRGIRPSLPLSNVPN